MDSNDESPVRVLVVDDDEDDYLIARDLLGEIENTRFIVDWVPDAAEAIRLLVAKSTSPVYDICLLDYRLGRINGLDILRDAIAQGTTVPMILLTGQEDSDVDREAVRIGASDYLVKGRINSILLERAIRFARQQKNTLEALREQTEFVSAILETAGALVLVLNRQGKIVRFNRQCELTTGYTFSEVEGQNYDFLLAPDESEAVHDVIENLRAGLGGSQFENDWVTREGERRRISWSNTSLTGRDGGVEFVVSTGIDVTDRRRAQAGLALAREREIEVGASIQRTLLVRKPPMNIPGVTVGATSLPSQKVGGDYFDFFIFGESKLDILVGDVMGKGVPAALMAAAAKSQFQRAVRRLGYTISPYMRLPEPDEIVTAVHSVLTKDLVALNSFLTLAYARFDLAQRKMIFVDCGHPRPLHISVANGTCRRISGNNMPLGMSEGERYKQIIEPFEPGDVFFFYSDGLTEACDSDDELFGEDRLVDAVTAAAVANGGSATPQEIADAAVDAVHSFCTASGTDIGDDLTCVAVRIEHWSQMPRLGFKVIEIPSDPNLMGIARDFAERFCNESIQEKLPEDDIDLIVLAVNEAVGNSIEHGYCGDEEGRIQIEAESFAQQVRFRIYDNGNPLSDRSLVPTPSFDGSRDSGFGLYIMEQCFDSVEHTRDEAGRNCVTLTKRFI